MPFFLTVEEDTGVHNDPSLITPKADPPSINYETTCTFLKQKYDALKHEFDLLNLRREELKSTAENCYSDVVKALMDRHQTYNQSIGKESEIERLSLEASELKKSKSELLRVVYLKDLEINEKNSSMKGYLDKIVSMTETVSARELRINELVAELSKVQASLARFTKEKELIMEHSISLDDELTSQVKSFLEVSKQESYLSSECADLERRYNDASSSLKWKDDKVKELESKLEALQSEFCSSKDAAAATEERFSAEISTANKLVELYKENSEDWSKKVGELEGVIKVLETHASQVEKQLDKGTSTIIESEKEVSRLKEKLEKYEAGTSGTALVTSVEMYEKYQEAHDALTREKLGRKHSELVLESVINEIKEKADVIMGERAEHERMVKAYDILVEKLQHSHSEQIALERAIQELKAELKRHELNYSLSQKDNTNLQKQIAVLLGSSDSSVENQLNVISDNDDVFQNIGGLVELNVKLQHKVCVLTELIESKEAELKETIDTDETASKVNAVLAEEQAQMIESLHTSVEMYKKLYEEEHKRHHSQLDTPPMEIRNNVPLLLEGSHDTLTRTEEKSCERIKLLEEEASGLRDEICTLKLRNKRFDLEVTFAHEKLERFIKDFDNQREETYEIIARNFKLSQSILNYQREIRQASDSLRFTEKFARSLVLNVFVLKREKEKLAKSEKEALEKSSSMSERLQQLQATLITVQSNEKVQEEAKHADRMCQEGYIKEAERKLADAKKELQEERDSSRMVALERESAMRGSMQRIEEMSARALRAVIDANARASDAEKRYSHSEKSNDLVVNNENPHVTTTKDDMVMLKEEIQKSQNDKDQMLYKSIAQVNEAALKQVEKSHEEFKSEADKVKKSLEDAMLSLQEQVNQLQDGCSSMAKKAASAASSQEEALSSAMSEISKWKEDCTSKMLKILTLESQMSALNDDWYIKQKTWRTKWRTCQEEHDKQVVLQYATIGKLTKQVKELQRECDILNEKQNELKSKLESEKLVLKETKDRDEKKFNEINEHNKMLRAKVESLLKLAEKSQASSNVDDGGLVVKNSSLSKLIAETEISLLKEQKLQLQSQLEGAVKAESAAKDLLRAERENSRSVHFREDEFKALQVQVREMNLLRESNVQLREENKHTFEDFQKYFQECQKLQSEVEIDERISKKRKRGSILK